MSVENKGIPINQDIFTLDEGEVVLWWPSKISPDDHQGLEIWLGLIGRKIKRAATAAESRQASTASTCGPSRSHQLEDEA